MEHHYSLTGRMRAIFVSGLVVLAALIFAAGLLVGRETGGTDAAERAAAELRARGVNPAAPAVATPVVPPGSAGNTAGGIVRPADALVAPPGASPATAASPGTALIAVPPQAVPSLTKVPAVPSLPKIPGVKIVPPIKFVPPVKSSAAEDGGQTKMARLSEDGSGQKAAEVPAPAQPNLERAARADTEVHGYVVYVGAFASSVNADKLMNELKRRNLDARISQVERPGRKPLVTVYVGPFGARTGAEAVIPEIRAAGVEEAMIWAVP